MSSWLAVLAHGEPSFGTSPQNPDMPSLSAFIAPYVGSQTGFGLNLVHVPYRGQAPALTDLLGGQVQLSFAGILRRSNIGVAQQQVAGATAKLSML
jgi:tripartite-type tricarboxylate transporter receptor subunit TctC